MVWLAGVVVATGAVAAGALAGVVASAVTATTVAGVAAPAVETTAIEPPTPSAIRAAATRMANRSTSRVPSCTLRSPLWMRARTVATSFATSTNQADQPTTAIRS